MPNFTIQRLDALIESLDERIASKAEKDLLAGLHEIKRELTAVVNDYERGVYDENEMEDMRATVSGMARKLGMKRQELARTRR